MEESIAAFEREWQEGRVPALGAHLCSAVGDSPDGRRDFLLELIAVDMEFRWRSASDVDVSHDTIGLKPSLSAYVQAFPELGDVDQLPPWIIAEEYRLLLLWEDQSAQAKLISRFRDRHDLLPLLRKGDREVFADTRQVAARRARSRPKAVRFDPRAPLPYQDYVLEGVLGIGGTGKVYRARQKSLGRFVAIKALRKSLQTDETAVELFLREARIVGRLRHPNIVAVHGLGRFPGGGYFMAMDLVDGQDLRKWQVDRAVAIEEAVRIVRAVIAAVGYAHERGVIHCDLKPANILIARDGGVFVTDFGFAHLLEPSLGRAAVIGGTLPYMAPELLDAETAIISPRVDIFGVGAILNSLLVGRDVPTRLAEICSKCLAESPQARFQSAAELDAALRD
jgi:hypothetical protein